MFAPIPPLSLTISIVTVLGFAATRFILQRPVVTKSVQPSDPDGIAAVTFICSPLTVSLYASSKLYTVLRLLETRYSTASQSASTFASNVTYAPLLPERLPIYPFS